MSDGLSAGSSLIYRMKTTDSGTVTLDVAAVIDTIVSVYDETGGYTGVGSPPGAAVRQLHSCRHQQLQL